MLGPLRNSLGTWLEVFLNVAGLGLRKGLAISRVKDFIGFPNLEGGRRMIATTLLGLALQVSPGNEFQRETLGQFEPVAVLEVTPSHGLNSEVFSIYAPISGMRPNGIRYLVIRRVIIGYEGASPEEWAIASECPGADKVLLDLEAMQPPLIDVPTIGRDDQQGPGLDGTGYNLTVRYPTWPHSFAYEMQFSTNLGSPLADWSDRLKITLEPCWSKTRPPAWGDQADRGD